MIGSNELAIEKETMSTMVELTSAFEGIASARIAQIREQVLMSQEFFGDLWRIYSQLRVDELFHFGRGGKEEEAINKELMVLITSEGSFSGDIDQRLVAEAIKSYDPNKKAILIIGHHGAVQLAQKGISYVRSFRTPEKDLNINTEPLVAEVQKYRSTVVYYQQYKSLMSQSIQSIRLSKAVMERGSSVAPGEEIIDESNYIFEPDAYAVVGHLELPDFQCFPKRHEIGHLRLDPVMGRADDGIAHAVAAFVLFELGLGRLPGRRPEFAVVVVADIQITAADIKRRVVVAVARQAAQARIAVERVAARGVRDDAKVRLAAEVIDPRQRGVGLGDDVFATLVVKMSVTHDFVLSKKLRAYLAAGAAPVSGWPWRSGTASASGVGAGNLSYQLNFKINEVMMSTTSVMAKFLK